MQDHFVYILGFNAPIKIDDRTAASVRRLLAGEVPGHNPVVVDTPTGTMMISVRHISALESKARV